MDNRKRDLEITRPGDFVIFRPISSAARQWSIDAMPDSARADDGRYLVTSKDAPALRDRIDAEGFVAFERQSGHDAGDPREAS